MAVGPHSSSSKAHKGLMKGSATFSLPVAHLVPQGKVCLVAAIGWGHHFQF